MNTFFKGPSGLDLELVGVLQGPLGLDLEGWWMNGSSRAFGLDLEERLDVWIC